MDRIFLIALLMFLLNNSCDCRPRLRLKRKDSVTFPAVRFSLNGHHFQIGLLTMPATQPTLPEIVTEECVKPAIENAEIVVPETQTITHFAMLNISPKNSSRSEAETETPKPEIPVKINEPLSTWNKVKSLYNELGNMLQVHEKELVSLVNQESSKTTVGVNTPSGETSIRVKISEDGNRDNALQKYSEQLTGSGSNMADPNSLNIHVHAEPPLNMRTIIGYPKSSRHIYSIKKRLYNRETSFPATGQDSLDESSSQSNLQSQSIEEETFGRRGAELLLNMWKRFKALKTKSKSQELQSFHEDVDDAKLTNRFLYYPNV